MKKIVSLALCIILIAVSIPAFAKIETLDALMTTLLFEGISDSKPKWTPNWFVVYGPNPGLAALCIGVDAHDDIKSFSFDWKNTKYPPVIMAVSDKKLNGADGIFFFIRNKKTSKYNIFMYNWNGKYFYCDPETKYGYGDVLNYVTTMCKSYRQVEYSEMKKQLAKFNSIYKELYGVTWPHN